MLRHNTAAILASPSLGAQRSFSSLRSPLASPIFQHRWLRIPCRAVKKTRSNTSRSFSPLLVDTSSTTIASAYIGSGNRCSIIGRCWRDIQTQSSDGSNTIKSNHPGLFSIPGLNQPSDFLRLASKASSKCNSLRSALSSSLDNEATANTTSAATETLHILDDISNEICSVIDAAELCRSAHASAKWRDAANDAFGILSDYIAKLNGDIILYRALVTVTTSPYFAEMTEEEQRVAVLLQHEFERDGIHLPFEERERVREVIGHVTQLEGLFNQNITNGRKLFDVDSSRVEAVVPKNILIDHVPQSEESKRFGSSKITVSTDAHIANSLLKYSADPILRREVYMEVNTACPQNLDVLDGLVAQRHDLATMLGFSSYAERFLQDKMARSPQNVFIFLDQMRQRCKRRYKAEMEMLATAKAQIEGVGSGPIEAWDVPFYTGALKAKKSGQDGDTNEVGGHFTVENCLEGMKILVRDLFGIKMVEKELSAGERWDLADDATDTNQPIRKFEFLHDEEGPLGTLYLDLHPREGKYAHAAHFTVRCGRKIQDSGEYQLPIVALVCNLSPAYANVGSTFLLSHSECETLYHEFGHALHSLLSRTKFQHLSGTRAAMDFIETPSHLIESFVWDPTFLRFIGKHYMTGQSIPESSISSLIASRNAFRAVEVQTQIVYARFDQELFGPRPCSASTCRTTTDIFSRLHMEHSVPYAEGSHWHSRFGHLVTYGAGYYGYLYSQVFAADIWHQCFSANPLCTVEGTKLWKEILRHGGAKDPNAMLRAVLGREPRVNSFFDSIS